ncbi:MAG: tRNA (adenosine(37)-N6)-threonylcarbamoyltransferase complex ATPase subunit type 1 TsaE [Planctomycetaceae bacterium]|nr:tRNA (adenosine(37)-N6)-threonylcarbamoyltransferase complex ATPase subunit type 1 TsaE [Planctomycetaceae bacterium]
MPDLRFIAHSEDETDRLGQALAVCLRPGDVVTLNGDLGAGKTRLVRSIVNALADEEQPVNSPTFVLIQQYDANVPIYHMDAYRLANEDEFLAMGADEILEGDGICLIEWADRIADALPSDHLRIDIEAGGPTMRRFAIAATGERSTAITQSLERELSAAQ